MDERVRDELVQRLVAFDGTIGGMRRLIADLDAAWAAGQSIPEPQRGEIRKQWENLEQVYATALDRGHIELGDADRAFANAATERLADLLRSL